MSTRVLTRAEEDVIMERSRQVLVENWTAEHDDGHVGGEMATAASAYAVAGSYEAELTGIETAMIIDELWPVAWDTRWFKPTTPRRNLVKAAAMLIAEIERLDRKP